MSNSNLKANHAETTRAQLVKQARKLFAKKGYSHVAMEEIVERAGMTRGALYHHFKAGKQELFLAVFETLEAELAEKLATSSPGGANVWTRFLAGCEAFLDACMEAEVRQIALIDAPAVLGWPTWRAIDRKYGFGLLCTGIQTLMEVGEIDRQPVEPLAHLVLGALCEAALVIGNASDVRTTRTLSGQALRQLLEGLRVRAKTGDS